MYQWMTQVTGGYADSLNSWSGANVFLAHTPRILGALGQRCIPRPHEGFGQAVAQFNSPAAMLMVNPRMAVLNTNPTNECASTTRRRLRPATPTSEVCTATLMVKEK
ncbi:hypothetical protein IAE38_003846 [Pseudomonas sp. S32]|nr:hypothetical protein [Pseudomonas sp. S32]